MELDKKKISELRYGNEIINFYNTVVSNLKIYNLEDLIYNLNTLKIVTMPTNFKEINFKNKKGHSCVYDSDKNRLLVLNDNIDSFHIYHELFHLLSTYHEKDIVCSGLSQYNKNNNMSLGNGINEGYTQLLKERYFGIDNDEKNYYSLEKHIVKHLEIIVGQRAMEKRYVNGDLKDFILLFKKYCDMKDFVDFINNVDYINKNEENQKEIDNVSIKLNDSLQFLINIYIKKQTLLYEKKLIDENIFKNNTKEFLNSISLQIFNLEKESPVL